MKDRSDGEARKKTYETTGWKDESNWNWKMKDKIALCGELALEEAMGLS